ncbi:MAG: zinc ribbon domain-containing protein [Methanomassiliicoccus sp.]|nr:zinc ribbon domain-containing protein [Methanomassiliicoccus sp.]
MEIKCSRCGADNPPTNKYCGQCGKALVEETKLGKTMGAVGWFTMAIGLTLLILTTAYYILLTVMSLWGMGEGMYHFIFPISYPVSGQGFQWPGLAIGVPLGMLGIVICAWPRLHVPGSSGKGIRGLMLIGSALVLAGAIFGAMPQIFYSMYGGENSWIARGLYSTNYQTLMLAGFTIILAGTVWAAWKGRRWGLPSTAIVTDGTADEGNGAHP